MSLQRASIQVSLCSLFVYLISFVNQLLIARTFGAGLRLDAYFAGSNIPLNINNIVGAVFVYAMVPHIVHEASNEESLRPRLAGLMVGCAGLSIITLAIGIVGHVIPLSQTRQFGTYQPEAIWAATLSWGSCALFFITALSDAIFNASKRFLFPVLAYLPAYLLTSFACFYLGKGFGGPVLAGATLVGYLLVLPVRAIQQKHSFGKPVDFSLFGEFIRRIPLTALAVMSLYAFPVVDTFVAPRAGEGVLSILGYSTRIISTMAVIVALGPFGVLIPELSAHSAANNRERFAARSTTLFRYALTLLIPVAAWVAIFRLPIIVLLLQRGEFGPVATGNLASLLRFNIPGSILMVLSMLVVRVFLADKRMVEAAVLSVSNLTIYFAMSFFLAPKLGLTGFGVAFVSAWALHTVIALVVLFRKDSVHIDLSHIARFFGRLSVASVVLVITGVAFHLVAPQRGMITTVLELGLSFVVCLFVYFGIGTMLKSPEHQRVWGLIARLARRSRSA